MILGGGLGNSSFPAQVYSENPTQTDFSDLRESDRGP